jgi:hypothetical protein
MPQIYFNGKTYNDLAHMPARERQLYEQVMSALKDDDGNGLPDILEGDVIGNITAMARKSGPEYSEQAAALETISPEMRARISKGLSKLNELGLLSGIQNMEQEVGASPAETTPTWTDAGIRPSKQVIPTQSVIQEDNGPRKGLVFGILVAVVIFLAGLAFIVAARGGF